MRLFVSINVSTDVRNQAKTLQEKLPVGKYSITKPEQMHITLKFLGEVSDSSEVKTALKQISFKPFKMRTKGLGVFPDEEKPRVIWFGFEDSSELRDLADQVRKALPKFKDYHPFHAHLTLARIKRVGDLKEFLSQKVESVEFEVNSFELMKSSLTPKGAVYEVVDRRKAL